VTAVLPSARQARNLPLDAHVHTDLSPDSDVPIDVYAALAVELGVAELAITDHVDFDPRDPAYEYATFRDRERTAREAAERWADRGLAIRFGAELTFNTNWEAELRTHLARHAYDFTIGSVHDWPESPYVPGIVRTWVHDRPLDEVVEPYFSQVVAAARSGLFDTIGHLDVVKRYLHPHVLPDQLAARPDIYEPVLAALVDSGTGLEVNTSGLRQAVAEAYPASAVVERFRELGGRRVTVGSDAHRAEWLAWGLDEGYRILARAEFAELTFRRGRGQVAIPLPGRFAAGLADDMGEPLTAR
jgi:histidinol-phosphatase (PHP family)